MRKRSVVLSITSLVLFFGMTGCGSTIDNPAKDLASTREATAPMSVRTPQPIMEDDLVLAAVPSAPAETVPPVVEPAAIPEPEPVPPVVVQTPEPVAPVAVPVVVAPEPVPVVPAPAPVPVAPVVVAPKQELPAKQEVVTPVVPVQPAVTSIYVGLSGGQGEVDKCMGPVRFTPVTQTVMVVEHDGCGGWARFGNMAPGQLVSLSGTVSGTYKIGRQMVVNKFASSKVIPAGFDGIYPPVVFQTCIPGTNQMVLTAAYPV